MHPHAHRAARPLARFPPGSQARGLFSAVNIAKLPELSRLAHFTYSMTVPSETAGAAAQTLLAFLAIQSRAARVLSSVPALSSQTATVNPPSAVRASK